jgi:tRNA pseudouridine38-40 synthase
MRIRFDLAYDGSGFAGWARQIGQRTVQQVLEDALVTVLRLPEVSLTVAGRTDSGVHARAQVAHADVPEEVWAGIPGSSKLTSEVSLQRRLAGVLPDDVRVHRVSIAPAGFDARFAALSRTYCYRIADHPGRQDPRMRGYTLWVRRELDVSAMAESTTALLGLHDFAAFCRPRPGATTIRTLLEYRWERLAAGPEQGLVVGTVRADAFCHNMVRALVGAALAVGRGQRPPSWPAQVLTAGQRDPGVEVVPPHGLTLEQVEYPADDALAERVQAARATRSALAVPQCEDPGE